MLVTLYRNRSKQFCGLLFSITLLNACAFQGPDIKPQAHSTPNSINTLLVCESSVPEYRDDCSQISPTDLKQRASQSFAEAPNKTVENIIIIHAPSAAVHWWQAHKLPGSIELLSLPPEAVMQNLAMQMQQLHELYSEMQQMFSFTQQPGGSMVNERGERMEDIFQPPPRRHNATTHSELTDCNTALSYNSRQKCRGYIANWIRSIDAQHHLPPAQWPPLQIAAVVDLTNLQRQMSNRTEPSDLVFRFVDDSTLVLRITPLTTAAGTPEIKVNNNASRTSRGLTFAQYQARHAAPIGVHMSGAELSSIYHYAACRDQEVQVERSKKYQVTTAYRQNGRVTITSVELMGSTPITETTQTCDTTGVPAPGI